MQFSFCPYLIFYSFGLIPIFECAVGVFKHLKKKWTLRILHDIFGFSLLIATVAWCLVGISIGEYVVNFIAIILLETSQFFLNLFTNYEEKIEVYFFRKLIVIITVSWIIIDAFQKTT